MANNGEVVEITLTKDMFECQILFEAVKAEGYEVHLLTDVGDTGMALPASASRLAVRSVDLDAVREILGRSHPPS